MNDTSQGDEEASPWMVARINNLQTVARSAAQIAIDLDRNAEPYLARRAMNLFGGIQLAILKLQQPAFVLSEGGKGPGKFAGRGNKVEIPPGARE